jgi:uncharacterized protein
MSGAMKQPNTNMKTRVVMTKWGDLPHWEYNGVLLGSDEHGDWVGVSAGTPMSRPGAALVTPFDQVSLVPGAGLADQRSFIATFHASGSPVSVYVDMTTPPEWSGPQLSAVDLDLDVIKNCDGTVWVDDEDEFAAHQVSLGYPDHIIGLASRSCARIEAMVRIGVPPFDQATRAKWLTEVSRAKL